jgi:hypothetical protein
LKKGDAQAEMPPAPTSEPDETDGEEAEPSTVAGNRRNWGIRDRRRSDANRQRDGDRGWFKLKWWKRRRRPESEPSPDEGDGVEGIDHNDTT